METPMYSKMTEIVPFRDVRKGDFLVTGTKGGGTTVIAVTNTKPGEGFVLETNDPESEPMKANPSHPHLVGFNVPPYQMVCRVTDPELNAAFAMMTVLLLMAKALVPQLTSPVYQVSMN